MEGHEEAVLDGASSLIATRRPVLMIELIEFVQSRRDRAARQRYAALSYDCFFFSRGALRPVVDFDAARDQDATMLPAVPPGREFIVNFFFIPAEKKARAAGPAVLTRQAVRQAILDELSSWRRDQFLTARGGGRMSRAAIE